MLGEILFVLLVLVVAALMAVDLVRTRGEGSHGHADRQAHSAERPASALPRGSAARAFSPEPVMGMTTVPAPDAMLSARETEATRAFDQMHREMSQSAAKDAALHDKLNAIFVNLSHRSQALVERQLRLIEDLEHGEQDQQRLAKLSKLNRIAIRMHRNSQNLLVLAGNQPASGWNQPVTLAHLVKAALAEVEDYERVSFEVEPNIAVRGSAANDLVHLLVELVENATSFSAAEMPVLVRGQTLTSGGALVDVTDRGIGMTAKEMASANHQLDNPPAVDIDVPKGMGLLVVARLAVRHGIRVRLNQAELGGLTALVWLPDEILTRYAATAPGHAAAGQRAAAAASSPVLASTRMNTQEVPAARPNPAWATSSPRATIQAESPAAARLPGSGRPDVPGGDVSVVVPHAENYTRTLGSPVFDEVESRWSGAGRGAPSSAGPAATAGPAPTGLPRRPPAAPAGPRAVPGTPHRASKEPGAAGRDGQTGVQ